MATIRDMVPGDYVKTARGMEKIRYVIGVNPDGSLAPPREGGFYCVTEDNVTVSMWDALSYHKAPEVEPVRCSICQQPNKPVVYDVVFLLDVKGVELAKVMGGACEECGKKAVFEMLESGRIVRAE